MDKKSQKDKRAAQGAPTVSTTPVANLPLVSTTPAANFATDTVGVVDTGGKFAAGVNNTRHRQQHK
jgi:hypothetical protein